MAAAMGLQLVMTRIPPPQYFVPTSIMQLFYGYEVNATPTLGVLVLDWRLNTLFAVLAVVAVLGYLAAVRRLRALGMHWPAGRTAAWLVGWAAVVITTSSGLGKYADSAFSLHMVLHMSLNMICPILLVLGGPATLAFRATTPAATHRPAGPHEWLRQLGCWPPLRHAFDPVWLFIEFVGSYYLIYFTPIFEQTMRFHWAHQLFNVYLIVVGCMFYGMVVGVDKHPHPLPPIGKLAMVLAAMPFHAFFGVLVMTSNDVIAETFFKYIDRPWLSDLDHDQYVGGGIAWAVGEIPLLAVVLVLLLQWSRNDRRPESENSGVAGGAYQQLLAEINQRSEPESLTGGGKELDDERHRE